MTRLPRYQTNEAGDLADWLVALNRQLLEARLLDVLQLRMATLKGRVVVTHSWGQLGGSIQVTDGSEPMHWIVFQRRGEQLDYWFLGKDGAWTTNKTEAAIFPTPVEARRFVDEQLGPNAGLPKSWGGQDIHFALGRISPKFIKDFIEVPNDRR